MISVETVTRRGRTPRLERRELRARAIEVVLRHGYDNVTMGQIADEVGLNVRTLHRYFPGKADIVWSGIEPSFSALQQRLALTDPATPTIDAISEAVTAVFADADEEGDTSRERLHLIATTPELQANRSAAFTRWRHEITLFVARRLGEPADGLLPIVAGAAIQAAIMESLGWWARQVDPGSPGEAVARGLRGVAVTADT